MAKLLIKTPDVAGPFFELRLGVNRVGRAADNHFQIQHDTISTHHCELVLGDGNVLLRDCNSTNGTFVNGEPITEIFLAPGQTIHLGDVELFVESTEVTVAIPQYDRPRPAPPVVVADGAMICPRHSNMRVTYQCVSCREVMCGKCVSVLRRPGGKTHMFCLLCSNPVEQIGGPKEKKKSFLSMLKETVKVPFPFARSKPPEE